MDIQLRLVTRDNWEECLNLKVSRLQTKFTPTVAVSLAKPYIKPDGEHVEYLPFAIYYGEVIVGFIMHAFEKETTDMYWINGFIIDEKYQGKGYGKSALAEMIRWIASHSPQCKEVRLTVYPENQIARRLYINFGFLPTGYFHGEEEVLAFSMRQ
ncbi:GNAT family N-acetyltransferase [Planococcus shenhongbingii]|uniref:GNAT family N-acetyltransferase n=1 Tax=Planococcus shenhongbingii TaxID=3058398 RepID=UPI00262796F9|nr:GNAT family N-acetyltransferase [Planococcus sp. N016]WKA58856.1 GNAT family N-acetyltransferase [Planococcus sp. N016]